MIEAAVLVIFPLCLCIAACSDMLTMTIPNRVSIILLSAFTIIVPFTGIGFSDILMHYLAGLAVFAVVFALFAANVMGGGDAKLLTASAVWFGWNPTLFTFLAYVGVLGGGLTLILLMLRSQADSILAMGIPVPTPLLLAKKIPYGIAIGVGGVLAYPSSPLVQMVLGLH